MQTPDRGKVFSSKELIDMALEGHFLLNDRIFELVWQLWERHGTAAREEMYKLPDMPTYPQSHAPIAEWENRLSELLARFETSRSAANMKEDHSQMKLPWS